MAELQNFEKLALLGITLSVKTKYNDSFTGELFFYSPITKILILKEKIIESNKYNYRYLNTEYLTEFKILTIKDINQIDFELQDIDFEEILRREKDPEGKGQPPETQKTYGEYLYQKLSSKYDVHWDGKNIKIDSIKLWLPHPYGVKDIRCADTKTVNEFRKQLEELRKNFK